ncbi:MAG: M28 family peptidase [Litorilinea sp.]
MRRLRSYSIELFLVIVLAGAVGFFAYLGYGLLSPSLTAEPFSGEQALRYAVEQTEFGDRITGTEPNIRAGDWIIEQLREQGWDVIIQPFTINGTPARNIVAIQGGGGIANQRVALLTTHYDSRVYADRDPQVANHIQPAGGANAGASGVGVLLELGRTLDVALTGHTVCMVFLDAEDNGGLEGWPANGGAQIFLSRFEEDFPRCVGPRFAVHVAQVGGLEQEFYAAGESDPALQTSIWQISQEQGYVGWRVQSSGEGLINTHVRFREQGIPAIAIAGLNYPYRHTIADTVDKLSAQAMEQIGRTLKTWLERGAPF